MKPFIDLKAQYSNIKDEVLRCINDILESSHYILGENVKKFEDDIKSYLGVSEAIGVASGTDALHLALKALDITQGDEVITTPFTFFATVEAILYVGAKPVFVDIDENTYNIAPEKIEEKITPLTKAIIPVHIFGCPADMIKINEIAQKYGLKIIEDAAQAFGAKIGDKKIGTFGDIACFSFYPSKNLGCFGDGGMVVTNNSEIAEKIRILRNHGSPGRYIHETVGLNSRLDEIQAGVLRIKLKHIDEYNSLRRKKANIYTKILSDKVITPKEVENTYHVYHLYSIRSENRDKIKEFLAKQGFPSVVYYPIPMHLQKAIAKLGYKEGDFPVAEKVSKEILSLPIYPEIPDEEVFEISQIIIRCLENF
ncbi:MAG: DegT/DnrJ/EryC1/StrS family aminotransferase [Thermodesulfovibrio sp.]|jgi:dTDP-4-amino-4,6-dideoxygalactose transaminase|uniref:DegT/DnrJ/EryC1/StrS family aminotransferase n=1 Tax=unclassified Thermodesulfovibrio TaxID=2645936 RepID=UPI00083ADB49|nr:MULTISPECIES: DegT/DnrJ/EryC1/StrS family aminotransferase [unclassified Thermodesulfovibrio]MDI1471344.1 DegT/DnrJ/EryC1/StrS family aminotransferase [Thermodesulfovibrio sp. 1176]MDI6714630.1 DegT/DnrJ/EryC1/StrS family aminotransferase [Thermodesulfovibrio sp.]ODA43837.1 UDP-4-amino-4-deoxy-L-arabinose--oxoglutarate aminotransferase [Thermodesulfovibrio sp. N1]